VLIGRPRSPDCTAWAQRHLHCRLPETRQTDVPALIRAAGS
jgi:hypothetical protein